MQRDGSQRNGASELKIVNGWESIAATRGHVNRVAKVHMSMLRESGGHYYYSLLILLGNKSFALDQQLVQHPATTCLMEPDAPWDKF